MAKKKEVKEKVKVIETSSESEGSVKKAKPEFEHSYIIEPEEETTELDISAEEKDEEEKIWYIN